MKTKTKIGMPFILTKVLDHLVNVYNDYQDKCIIDIDEDAIDYFLEYSGTPKEELLIEAKNNPVLAEVNSILNKLFCLVDGIKVEVKSNKEEI